MGKKNQKVNPEDLYGIVKKFRAIPKSEAAKNKAGYNYTNPTILRALRIHRHLRALETQILDAEGSPAVSISLQPEPNSDRMVLSIRNSEVHCFRVAYLTPEEFTFLRQNRKVARVLQKCQVQRRVA